MSDDTRHKLLDRLFHWIMAILVLILLGTAFLPILGLKFNWLPTHWISGVILVGVIFFHLYRTIFVQGLHEMLPTRADLKFSSEPEQKYDFNQKLYHWTIAAIMTVLLITGVFMLARIDTIFWQRDPTILSDGNWGLIYAFHGCASMLLIFFFILHVYFAFLPEHRELLQSMIFGKASPKSRKPKKES